MRCWPSLPKTPSLPGRWAFPVWCSWWATPGPTACCSELLLAPVAWYAGNAAASWGLGPAARPLVYLGCIAAVSAVEMALLHLIKLPWQRQLLRILPLAALNSCVLGTLCW